MTKREDSMKAKALSLILIATIIVLAFVTSCKKTTEPVRTGGRRSALYKTTALRRAPVRIGGRRSAPKELKI